MRKKNGSTGTDPGAIELKADGEAEQQRADDDPGGVQPEQAAPAFPFSHDRRLSP